MTRVVLVTGVSDDFAARCARALAALEDTTVVGVDLVPPRRPLEGVTFVRADVRSPVMASLIAGRDVDTVVHLAHVAADRRRASMKELNVIGTMQLLAACQRAPGFRRLVLPSSVLVYGSSYRDPAVLTEEHSLRAGPRTSFAQDCIEIESYARALAQRRDDVDVTILRNAELLGAGVRSDLTRYLTGRVVPRVGGFDARLQFLHPADGARAVTTAVERPADPGHVSVCNVAAPDVVVLSQLLGWLGRPALPLPRTVARALQRTSARTGLAMPGDLDGMTWGRVVSVRRAAEELGFEAHWTSRHAAEEFVALTRPGVLRRVLEEIGEEERG